MRARKAGLWALLALACGLGVWWLWPRDLPGSPITDASAKELDEDFAEVEVRAPPGQSGLTLRGRLQDTSGAPIPDAEVHLVAALQPRLSSVTCPWKEATLLGCEAPETGNLVQKLLEQGQGVLRPALTVRSDAEGRFVFENLAGVSFTVWGSAPGFGAALVDRAAPGDAVTLILPQARSLSGRVVDNGGRGMAGVKVWAVSRKLSIGASTVSGANGDFSIEGLGEGPFYLMASREGLLPAVVPSASPSGAPVELRLRKPQTLEVRVLRDGAPSAATVLLEAWHLRRTLEVDGHGVGRFGELELRDAAVRATSGALASERLMVRLLESENAVTLHLQEAGSLWLTVTAPDGQPIPKLELSLHQAGTGLVEQATAEEGAGHRFGPLAPGDYWVSASATGFEREWLPIRINPGEQELELTLRRGTIVSGRVLDMYGRGAAGVSVLAQPLGESAVADASGAFTLTLPSAGQYTLSAHHSDWGGVERTVQAPSSDVELSLEPGASMQIRVELEGRPVEGASVRAWTDPTTIYTSDTLSGADGVVWMRGMEPGTYSLFAVHPHHLQSPNVVIPLGEGETQTATVALRAGSTLTGEVVDGQGQPVARANVIASGRGVNDSTDAAGRFELEGLEDGKEVELRVLHPDYDTPATGTRVTVGQAEPVRLVLQARERYRGRVVSSEGKRFSHYTVDQQRFTDPEGTFEVGLEVMTFGGEKRVMLSIEADGHAPLSQTFPATQHDLGTLTLQASPQLRGRVVDAEGGPVHGARVSCRECRGQALSGQDGTFALEVPTDFESYGLTASRGDQSAELEVPSTAQDVEVTLGAAAKLEGVLFDAGGTPLPGAVMAISGGGADPRMMVTGEGGTFSHSASPGVLRIGWDAGEQGAPPIQILRLPEGGARLTLGAAPGTARLTVEAPPRPGYMLALVKGSRPIDGPVIEWIMRSDWARLAQRLSGPMTRFDGVPAGTYQLIYGPTFVADRSELQMRSISVQGDTTVQFDRRADREQAMNPEAERAAP